MLAQEEVVLAECLRVETMLHNVQRSAVAFRPEIVADCDRELSEIAALLEVLRKTLGEDKTASALLDQNPAIRQALQRIRRMAGKLKVLFEQGANYCGGLLQTRLGAGYSPQGLPVLILGEARSSFEG